jgi:hypothetical protein
VVHQGDRRVVIDAAAPGAQAQAEVDVLEVEEEALVEAADALEVGTPQEQGGA